MWGDMIHQATGTVIGTGAQQLFLAVGQISYEVNVPNGALYREGDDATVYIHLHWNQESGPTLYGFSSEDDRAIFRAAISCTGVGPKVGLAILADIGVQGFLGAVQAGDERALSKVSGIGPKRAEQMLVQLRHKVMKLMDAGFGSDVGQVVHHWQSLREALESLNYSRTEVTRAIDHLRKKEVQQVVSFDQLMRGALAFLSKQS